MLKWFPLMLIVVVLYNVLIFLGPMVVSQTAEAFLARSVSFTMFSGDIWRFSMGDFILLLGFCVLFVEIVKATRTGSNAIMNHGLSMGVFILALIEFLVLPGFSTTTFFFLAMMCLFDVVAGFTISIVSAKRDFGHSGTAMGPN
jgi:hypothetical protein